MASRPRPDRLPPPRAGHARARCPRTSIGRHYAVTTRKGTQSAYSFRSQTRSRPEHIAHRIDRHALRRRRRDRAAAIAPCAKTSRSCARWASSIRSASRGIDRAHPRRRHNTTDIDCIPIRPPTGPICSRPRQDRITASMSPSFCGRAMRAQASNHPARCIALVSVMRLDDLSVVLQRAPPRLSAPGPRAPRSRATQVGRQRNGQRVAIASKAHRPTLKARRRHENGRPTLATPHARHGVRQAAAGEPSSIDRPG